MMREKRMRPCLCKSESGAARQWTLTPYMMNILGIVHSFIEAR